MAQKTKQPSWQHQTNFIQKGKIGLAAFIIILIYIRHSGSVLVLALFSIFNFGKKSL